MSEHQVAVVGAGPSGIAAALALKDVGLHPLVLDRADQVASSWRGRYDRLRLNTCRPFSHLPDRPFPKGTPMFPSRDEVVEHFERHAREEGLELKLGTQVMRIDRGDDSWVLATSAGEVRAPQAIVSTGFENAPIIPGWRGRDGFEGRLLHSSKYLNPEPFEGLGVLVVGSGSSGMEIANDLATGGAAKVWLAVRTPPNILMREGPGGLPGDMLGVALLRAPARFADAVTRFGRRMDVGDLTEYGLPVPEEGVFSRMRRLGVAPSIVDKEVIESIMSGGVEVVPAVEELAGEEVRLAGGARLAPDAVISATGYRRGLEPLVGHLDVLDERGTPRALGATAAAAGMRFIGYVPRPGGIGYMGKEAKRAAKAIAGEVGQPATAGLRP